MTDEEVPPALAGERLDRTVALVTGWSRARAAAVVAEGGVRVVGAVEVAGARRLAGGERLAITAEEAATDLCAPDPTVAVPVVHADDDVIVVDKPAGLVVHPGAGNREGTMAQGLLARFPELAGVGDPARPGIVHRLDKGTSGLVVVARSAAAHHSLTAQLAERQATRTYLALVWGHPDQPRGVVDAPIGRSARQPTRMTVSAEGRGARTRYEVESCFADPAEVSLLSCGLETGRTHQIRVHLAAIGHPLVGDDRYGGLRSSLSASRPCLHAAELAFAHPATGERVTFTSPLPEDLVGLLAGLA